MANVIGPHYGWGDQNGFAGRKASTSRHGSWERQRVLADGIREHATMGGHWAQKKGRPLALKAGGQAGPVFQLSSHGSGNAIQFPDISSHIPAPSKSQTRGNCYLGPLA